MKSFKMKKHISISTGFLLLGLACFLFSCKKEYGNLNSPTIEDFLKNASQSQLNNLVSGTESGMRNNLSFYFDDAGSIGREGYRFSGSEPRYVTDLLGANANTLTNSNFYITNPWAARYRVVKNCNVLIQAATNSTLVTDAQKKAYTGFAKTIKAYELLLNVNLTDSNGLRIDVDNPDNLGPIVSKGEVLTAIAGLLDAANADLNGSAVNFQLSSGFAGLSDAAGLSKFNRALAARVAVYQKKWDVAQTALAASFYSPGGGFSLGVYHVFSTGSGDQVNPMFIPQNNNGEIRVAHPSYAADIEAGDDRIAKATLRTTQASLNGLTSDRDVWVYTSSTARLPIIRNEELILINAEINIQLNNLPDAVASINVIRKGHNLPNYSGTVSQAALIDEMLKQRRYSLYYEGHRWVDMRRYNRLATLPIDRSGDNVWTAFPLPNTEQ
jgi:hypothetical protein